MATNKEATKPIYTIGYGGRVAEEFFALLKKYGAQFLVDIRSRPYSGYRPEFSREPLAARLQRDGIRYVFMGDTLGGQPDDTRCYVDGKVDYSCLRDQDSYQGGIARLHAALEKHLSLVLMCTEAKPEECHRSKLIGQTLSDTGIEVIHIDESGDLKTQGEVISLLTGGQVPMFDSSFVPFRSRKRYRDNKG